MIASSYFQVGWLTRTPLQLRRIRLNVIASAEFAPRLLISSSSAQCRFTLMHCGKALAAPGAAGQVVEVAAGRSRLEAAFW